MKSESWYSIRRPYRGPIAPRPMVSCPCCSQPKRRNNGHKRCVHCVWASCQFHYGLWKRNAMCPAAKRARRNGRKHLPVRHVKERIGSW